MLLALLQAAPVAHSMLRRRMRAPQPTPLFTRIPHHFLAHTLRSYCGTLASTPAVTKAELRKQCKERSLYGTPSCNDKLYLHYKGYRRIENLDEYTALKVVWLEGNGFQKIEGLEHQLQLRTLYLQENLIEKIENLSHLVQLDSVNLAQNNIRRIENLGNLNQLQSLHLKNNHLKTADDIRLVLNCPSLTTLDLQHNKITDVDVLDVVAQMPNLRVLYLQGNDVVKQIKHYRKTVISRCKQV